MRNEDWVVRLQSSFCHHQQMVDDLLLSPQSLSSMICFLEDNDKTIRSNAFQVIENLASNHPHTIDPFWEHFEKKLMSSNAFHRYQAVHILAHLTATDSERRFNSLFDAYYQLLYDESVMVVNHVILMSAPIILNKPELRSQIVKLLLDFDRLDTRAQHKELSKAYIVELFEECFGLLEEMERVIDFVRGLVDSSSPKTRKAAKQFLQLIE